MNFLSKAFGVLLCATASTAHIVYAGFNEGTSLSY